MAAVMKAAIFSAPAALVCVLSVPRAWYGCHPFGPSWVYQALVIDASGEVAGMITIEDVLGELLGAVPDEFKASRLLPLRLPDGRVRLPLLN